VLDVSLDKNRNGLIQALDAGAGVYGNGLVNAHPDRAHAVITDRGNAHAALTQA
jgi:hypothetical protein